MGYSEDDFALNCLCPAVELRQRIRDELHKMDQEFAKVEIGIEGLIVTPTVIQSAPPVDMYQILEEKNLENKVGSLIDVNRRTKTNDNPGTDRQ